MQDLVKSAILTPIIENQKLLKQKIEENIQEVLGILDYKEIKFKEIIEIFKKYENKEQYYEDELSEISIYINPSEYDQGKWNVGQTHVYLDLESDIEFIDCEYQLNINKDGFLTWIKRRQDILDFSDITLTYDSFETFLYKLKMNKVKILDISLDI